jgi:hypothetical protein
MVNFCESQTLGGYCLVFFLYAASRSSGRILYHQPPLISSDMRGAIVYMSRKEIRR